MKKKILIELFILLSIIAGIWYGFSKIHFSNKTFNIGLSNERKEKFGKMIFNQIKSRYPEIKNKKIIKKISKIKVRLLKNLEKSDINYKLKILSSEIKNAFTLPGGYIIIFSGLIDFIDTSEEFSAVLAHEIAHTELNHIIKKIIKTIGLEVLATIITGGDSVLLSEVSKILASNTFDRSQESDADQFAMNLMVKSKIDPRNLATFFRKLKEYQNDISDELAILSTHPANSERIKSSLEYKLPENFKAKKIQINWKKIQKLLK